MSDQKYFPTLVIGVGGIGSHIAARVREKMLANDSVRELEGNLFVFAAIDTDSGELDRLNLEPQCRIHLSSGMDKIGRYIRSDPSMREQRRAGMGNFVDVDSQEILDHDLSKGAGQFRALSRAAWELGMSSGDLKAKLDRVIEKIRVPSTLASSLGQKPEVYVVTSIAGGTGSGSSLLVGRYVKHYLESRNISPIVKGLLLLPDIFCHSPQAPDYWPGLRANSYGYLKELEMTFIERLKGTSWVLPKGIEFLDGLDRSDVSVFPFKFVYLVGEGSRKFGRLSDEVSYEPWERLVAQAIYSRILSPKESTKTASTENNIIDKLLEGEQAPLAPPRTYCSLGSSCLMYSTKDTVAYLSNRKIVELVGNDWTDIDERYRLYQQEEQKRKLEGIGTSKPRPQYLFFIDTIEQSAKDEATSSFMKLIHREVLPKIDNQEYDEPQAFFDAIEDLLQSTITGKMHNDDSADQVENIRPIAEDSFDDLTKSDLLRTLENYQHRIEKVETSLKEKLTQYQSECFRNIVFGPSGVRPANLPKYTLGHWIPAKKSIFGVRYFVSRVLKILDAEYHSLNQDYPRLEKKLVDLKDFDSEAEGVQTPMDAAVKLPERKGVLDLPGKRKYKEFVGKFVSHYNGLLSNMKKYYETSLKRWVIGKLIDILGESNETGGLLNLIYGAISRIIGEKDRLDRDLERLSNGNAHGVKEYENVAFVYSNKEARTQQWKLIQPQLASDPTFNEVCYKKMSEELVGLWSAHQATRLDPDKRSLAAQQNRTLGMEAGQAVSTALFKHVAERIQALPEVSLSLIEAVRREVELNQDPDPSGKTALGKYVDLCIKRAEPLINLKNISGMKALNFLTCFSEENAEIVNAFNECFRVASESDQPQVVGDSFYGKDVAIFSRTALCFRLQDTLLLDPSSHLKEAYTKRGENMGPHIVRSFFHELPDPDPDERLKVVEQFGRLLMFGIIEKNQSNGEFILGVGDRTSVLNSAGKPVRTFTELFAFFGRNRSKLDPIVDRRYGVVLDKDYSRPDHEKEYPRLLTEFIRKLNAILRSLPIEHDRQLVDQMKEQYLNELKKLSPKQYEEFMNDPGNITL